MTKQKQKQASLTGITLHRLIGTFSFLGSSARLLLIASIALAVFAGQMIEAGISDGDSLTVFTFGIQGLLYAIGSFFVLDVGYLLMVRAYSLPKKFDHAMLFVAEIILALVYFLPYFLIVSLSFAFVSKWIIIGVLGVLAARLLIGLLYGTARR